MLRAGLLLLVSLLVVIWGNMNRTDELVLAARQIQIGSDWRTLCAQNEELWNHPSFLFSTANPTTIRYVYGGAMSRNSSKIESLLSKLNISTNCFSWFYVRDKTRVEICVDQNGDGKVVHVTVSESW